MDPIPSGVSILKKKKKKRARSDEASQLQDDCSKISCPSSLPSSTSSEIATMVEHMFAQSHPRKKEAFIGEDEVKLYLAEVWHKMENEFRRQVSKQVEKIIRSKIHEVFLPSLSKQRECEKDEVTTLSITSKYKLIFLNSIAPIIFTNNEIESEDGNPLAVAICDATNSNNIITTGHLSSATVNFHILSGDFDSTEHRDDETPWPSSDFNKNILTPRVGKRPLICGNDLQLRLQNGFGMLKNLIVTDNSSWMKSKKFRLGVKINNENSLHEFGSIGEAVSRPFRVRDQRGEGNKKHHPPSSEDEVWRLEGIGKDGIYHRSLSFQGIRTVGDFLKAYEMSPTRLRTLLGRRVLDKTWNMMVNNARECVFDDVAVNNDQTIQVDNYLELEDMMRGEDFDGNSGFIMSNDVHYGYNQLPSPQTNEELLEAVVYRAEASNKHEVDDAAQNFQRHQTNFF